MTKTFCPASLHFLQVFSKSGILEFPTHALEPATTSELNQTLNIITTQPCSSSQTNKVSTIVAQPLSSTSKYRHLATPPHARLQVTTENYTIPQRKMITV